MLVNVNGDGKGIDIDSLALENCPNFIRKCASKHKSVVRRLALDFGLMLSESPQKVWNEISEDVGHDMSEVLCPELFTKEKPNGYSPNLDSVMHDIKFFVELRMENADILDDVTPFEAELYGVYCALFLRARMDDILSQDVIEDYDCLMDAVEFLTRYCDNEDIRSFWCGFESYLPIVTNEAGIQFLHKYSSTPFGSILLYEFTSYCEHVKEYLSDVFLPQLETDMDMVKYEFALKEYKAHYNEKAIFF